MHPRTMHTSETDHPSARDGTGHEGAKRHTTCASSRASFVGSPFDICSIALGAPGGGRSNFASEPVSIVVLSVLSGFKR